MKTLILLEIPSVSIIKVLSQYVSVATIDGMGYVNQEKDKPNKPAGAGFCQCALRLRQHSALAHARISHRYPVRSSAAATKL